MIGRLFLPWRCRDCYARFFRWRWVHIEEDAPPPKAHAVHI
jgi:hypothetical protein